MRKLFLLLLFPAISCSNGLLSEEEPLKDYTSVHKEAQQFCKTRNFSQEYYFLIDLSIHSGKNRFFVYNFKQCKISCQSLVTHGSCDVYTNNHNKYKKANFDNCDNSHCSSSGKYKVGRRDYSSWGMNVKYWLDGLEDTNDNARDRVVVLHSWSAVANSEIYHRYSPLSWGCPAVSDTFMKVLDAKLLVTDKPVLLWIIKD
jgi:hypothetical protein